MSLAIRKQIDYNKPVGIVDGILYLVNYTFIEDSPSRSFCGVTGSKLEPVTQEQVTERNSEESYEDYCDEMWREVVHNGRYNLGLAEFIEEHKTHMEGDFPGHDMSDVHLVPDVVKQEHFPDAVTFDCRGGGRCFYKNMKFDVILDQHLVNEINRLEVEKYEHS